jgi:crossover junction endodeoxyribonuclease RuvC
MTIILGIDPGSRVTGYGVIELINGSASYLDSGCIRTGENPLPEKLLTIFNGICTLMDMYDPIEVAIESVFLSKNVSVALKLGHARGVAMVAASSARAAVFEYPARLVKQTIVGFGAAEKAQVGMMVMQLLSLSKVPQVDAADALAIALCHASMRTHHLKVKERLR